MRLFGLLTGLALTAAETTWDPIPSVDGVAITKHFLAREAMLKLEESQRQDHEFRQRLSPIAIKADAIVRKSAPTNYSTSGAKRTAQTTPSPAPCSPRPSLHHQDQTMDHRMAVSASQSLNSEEARRNASIAFSTSTTFASGTPITADEYVAILHVQAGHLPEQATRHDLGVDEIWRRFESLFGTAGTLLTYEPIVRTFYRQLFSRLVDDGVSWVEIRAGGRRETRPRGEQDADPDLDAWWELMQDEMERFKASERISGGEGHLV
ncbi:adenosine deaminase family protein [Ophiocordyceps camponoti-floridani]|uniref:Adenosine deaminase family protein n=1 Tax=Ophiocordyceps camponoti-floridani TaxID=2030778 RepID=A0A8H4VAB2_9HYPO|nr:adenosine deaminase family protein [Ophiocordyceps camponoti-floridani]